MLGSNSMEAMNNITYPQLDGNRWKQSGPNTLEIDWDSEDNITSVRQMVALIKKDVGVKRAAS